jgi:2-keto-4-pentenoate hydratase/2-oxohepta-3-ene-1,7-dioic acid hydratase in catechol pathway
MPTTKYRPGKIVCVGRNYREHAKELGNEVPKEPLLFLKPPSSVVHESEAIRLPKASSKVEHEGEIGVIVGKRLSWVSEEDAARGRVLEERANEVAVLVEVRRLPH